MTKICIKVGGLKVIAAMRKYIFLVSRIDGLNVEMLGLLLGWPGSFSWTPSNSLKLVNF
jgi:hypothetical protein